MNISVLTAVFKRNFFSYFTNPTGYVFICVFVFLSAIAAFWPDAFFISNLANLDELNAAFPFIMLCFVPAITMGIWAEETRQGTDELLLTMPATDFDIVLGKYLAAVSIYTVALVIAMVSNFLVLYQLGSPDKGLYLCTHLGYWFLGLSMLAIGMVASFLTRNLTVSYILGAMFNAPLVLMARIDIIPGLSHSAAAAIRQWSMGGQTQEFGKGMLAFSGIVYFLFIAAIMLYACMVLIGRRNWARGDDAGLLGFHYLVRIVALFVVGAAIVFTAQNHETPIDATSEQLSTLSPFTVKLIKDLKGDYDEAVRLQPAVAKLEEVVRKQDEGKKKETPPAKSSNSKADAPKGSRDAAKPASSADVKKPEPKAIELPATPLSPEAKELAELKAKLDKLKVHGPVRIDAYISTDVPESYIQTRINLLADLQAIKDLAGKMVELNINDMTHGDNQYAKLADQAKTRFNIVAKEEMDTKSGAFKRDEIFLGVAFTSGLEKIVLPFMDKGLPAEYELVQSLRTITGQKRKRVGVLDTDAHVFGDFTQMGMSPPWKLIEELKRQYDVVQVRPSELSSRKPGDKDYDVLLAIQPSSMGPPEMEDFIKAVRGGQKTVILEDPFLFFLGGIPGTYQPKQPQSNPMMGFNQPPPEKGDIRPLWRLLGIDFSDGGESAEFNPMPGSQFSSGTGRLVWQRYNPYPKLGDLAVMVPEFVFVDPSCGAKEPFNEQDPVSSKLQHLFFPGPGFIEDTPDVVKRVIAKWHNAQYTRQLERTRSTLDKAYDAARAEVASLEAEHGKADEAKLREARARQAEAADRWADVDGELTWVTGGGQGKKTLQPDRIHDEDSLKSLLKDLEGQADSSALYDLRRDMQARFPIRIAGEGISEDEAGRLGDLDFDRLDDEAKKMKDEAAKASQGKARLLETAAYIERVADLKRRLSAATTVQQLMKYAEGVLALQIQDRSFTPLVQTGFDAGTVPVREMILRGEGLNPARSLFYQQGNDLQYTLAAHIEGKAIGPAANSKINVVLIGDVDMIGNRFFEWREEGTIPGLDIPFDFDNVTFVLNALDSLSGDTALLDLRKRRPQHRTLKGFDEHTEAARRKGAQARRDKSIEHDENIQEAMKNMQKKLKLIEIGAEKGDTDENKLREEVLAVQRTENKRLQEARENSDEKYKEEMRKINMEQEAQILGMQGAYKLLAVIIPPIPPLLVAAFVFFHRRAKEREGVSRSRLR
jgi:ABC-type transport system involved in multi-copper enzyme maturation permease subunit